MADSKEAKSSDNVMSTTVKVSSGSADIVDIRLADNKLLAELGYSAEFKREFSVRSTLSYVYMLYVTL